MSSAANFDDRQLLSAIFQCMGEGLYAIDATGRVLTVNQTAAEILGYTPNELVGKVMHDTTHYKHRDGSPFPKQECSGFKVITNGETVRVDQDFFIRKDGSFVPVSYTSSPITRDGQIVGAAVAFQDISARLEHEADLRKATTHLRLVYQHVHIGTWEWHVSSDVLHLSPEFAEICGLAGVEKTSLAGFIGNAIFFDSDRRFFEETLRRSLRKRKEFRTEFRIRHGNDVRWVLLAGTSFYNLGDLTVIGIALDTTELKAEEQRAG